MQLDLSGAKPVGEAMTKRITITVETEVTKEMELTFGLFRQLSETIDILKLEIKMENVRERKPLFGRCRK